MEPASFILPEVLFTLPYELRSNPAVDIVLNTQQWVLKEMKFTEEQRARYLDLKGGVLASFCYPDADAQRIQAVSDFIDWLFCFDDVTDDCTEKEAKDLGNSVIKCFHSPCKSTEDVPVCRLAHELVQVILHYKYISLT